MGRGINTFVGDLPGGINAEGALKRGINIFGEKSASKTSLKGEIMPPQYRKVVARKNKYDEPKKKIKPKIEERKA